MAQWHSRRRVAPSRSGQGSAARPRRTGRRSRRAMTACVGVVGVGGSPAVAEQAPEDGWGRGWDERSEKEAPSLPLSLSRPPNSAKPIGALAPLAPFCEKMKTHDALVHHVGTLRAFCGERPRPSQALRGEFVAGAEWPLRKCRGPRAVCWKWVETCGSR